MLAFANAKINLGLYILNKRNDEFHNLESVFYPIPLYDIIEINLLKNTEQNFQFINSGLTVNSKIKDNLCVRAYTLLKEEFKLPSVNIHLHKLIPFGAGLGGGSSDAACTINTLDKLFKLKLTISNKLRFANELGSDCAFFIKNRPSFVSGKGDYIDYLNLDLSGYFLVLIYPPIIINTGEAYKKLKLENSPISLKKIIYSGIKNWKNELHNNFEKSIFKKHSDLQNIKNKLYKLGAIYASMSGSGSSIFGIFKEKIVLKSKFPSNYFTWQKIL